MNEEITSPVDGDAVRQRIRKIVFDTLGHGVDDGEDYFDAGGTSAMAAALVARCRDEFGVRIPLRGFFGEPTIESLARTVSGALDERW